MAPRTVNRRDRDYDFTNVGIAGRRTGVTVEHRPLDDHGFEQVSSFFSSPRKSSPLKQVSMPLLEGNTSQVTPKSTISSRRLTRGGSIPPPRSASPRKSGITGTAKRNNIVDRNGENNQVLHNSNQENEPPQSLDNPKTVNSEVARTSHMPNRFSPEKTPLKSHIATKPRETSVRRRPLSFNLRNSVESDLRPTERRQHEQGNVELEEEMPNVVADDDDDDDGEEEYDQDSASLLPAEKGRFSLQLRDNDDQEVDQSYTPQKYTTSKRREPTQANSRKKRKADVLDDVAEDYRASSPTTDRTMRAEEHEDGRINPLVITTSKTTSNSKPRAATKSLQQTRLAPQISSKQEQEIDDIVQRVRSRPDQQKSLYILRRETPLDEEVTHTRSGRVSVKPLAYWRNERCVYGGSPGGQSIADGARFPLNSIKEIIRTEQEYSELPAKKRKGKPNSSKNKGKGRAASEVSLSPDIEDEEQAYADPYAEPWEIEVGTVRGPVSVWDHEQQAPVEQEEEVDIAYAFGAIETKEVKGSSFRYAKLLSTKFFSTGIVDLPPGAVKRPKNSRKMHMSFFVAKGRVTVEVGPLNGPESRFSIGKGGFWQVPRGNQYSIHNEHERAARIFFSQACEPVPQDEEE